MGALWFYFFFMQSLIINKFLSPDLSGNFACLQTLSFGKGFILAVVIAVLPGTTGITPQIYCILCKSFIKIFCSKTIFGFLRQANLKKN